MKKLNSEELNKINGGSNQNFNYETPAYIGGLSSGYLAVRSSAEEKTDNLLGGLLNGARVTILNRFENGYTLINAYCGKTAWTEETGWQTGWAKSEHVIPTV